MAVLKGSGLSLAALLVLVPGCMTMGFMTGRPSAVCAVAALGDGRVQGKVTFTEEDGDMLVEAELDGLSPGKHGIHIHEHGDCQGLAGEAAGGHFNPTKMGHGRAAMVDSHEGDLGNVTADARGHVQFTLRDKWLRLTGDEGILGRSVIVHAQADDLSSQPAGNSGARIACGVITAVQR